MSLAKEGVDNGQGKENGARKAVGTKYFGESGDKMSYKKIDVQKLYEGLPKFRGQLEAKRMEETAKSARIISLEKQIQLLSEKDKIKSEELQKAEKKIENLEADLTEVRSLLGVKEMEQEDMTKQFKKDLKEKVAVAVKQETQRCSRLDGKRIRLMWQQMKNMKGNISKAQKINQRLKEENEILMCDNKHLHVVAMKQLFKDKNSEITRQLQVSEEKVAEKSTEIERLWVTLDAASQTIVQFRGTLQTLEFDNSNRMTN